MGMWMPAEARRGHWISGAVLTHGRELPLDRWWELKTLICQSIWCYLLNHFSSHSCCFSFKC